MSSTFPALEPSSSALQALGDGLEGNLFRGVDGSLARYFEETSWSQELQEKMQDSDSADAVHMLCAAIPSIGRLDTLLAWLAEFQSLFGAVDPASPRFYSQPLCNVSTTRSAMYLETATRQSITGSTRAFGEAHNRDTTAGDDKQDDKHDDLENAIFLRFFE